MTAYLKVARIPLREHYNATLLKEKRWIIVFRKQVVRYVAHNDGGEVG